VETQTEDGKAHLSEFVQNRLHAIDAQQLIPHADRMLDMSQPTPHRAGQPPMIAIISRPGENEIGKIHMRYAQASETLVSRLQEAGAIPLIVPETNHLEAIPLLFGPDSQFDGVVVPGTDWSDLAPEWYGEENIGDSVNTDRDLDRFDMAVILWCTLIQPTPFLSMCLGFQAWNVVMGGSLYQDLVKQREPQTPTLDHSRWALGPEAEHQVIIDATSRLYHAVGRVREVQTNTLHHQGVHEVAPGLIAVARSAPDWVVEALEFDPRWMKFMGVRRQFALGTQFHPELPVTHRASASALSKIIPSFVLATRKRR
jgi:putative glutamine amidotransferase